MAGMERSGCRALSPRPGAYHDGFLNNPLGSADGSDPMWERPDPSCLLVIKGSKLVRSRQYLET